VSTQDSGKDFLYERAAFYYNHILNSVDGEYAVNYLKHRGITLRVANNFMLGATPPCNGKKHSNALALELVRLMDTEQVLASRLISSSIDEQNKIIDIYDYFSNGRIITPIFSKGNPIYFTSRLTFNGNLPHKHINSSHPMSNIFNQDILSNDNTEIYLTEGIFDALSLAMINKNAIATLGTRGVSIGQRELFTRKFCKYVFVFDNDENKSGQHAVTKTASILKSFGIDQLYQIILPRKQSSSKTDINQLLCQCLHSDHTLKDFSIFFDNLERLPLVVDTYQPPIKTDYKYTSNTEIMKVISDYVTLSRISPTSYKGVCPFKSHEDTNPSFVVYTTTNTFKCFGCGKYGGPVTFLMEFLNLSKEEAINKVKQYK